MKYPESKGIRGSKWVANEIFREDDANFINESQYTNFIASMIALVGPTLLDAADIVVSGLELEPDTLLTLSLPAGVAVSSQGYYLLDGTWGWNVSAGDTFGIVVPLVSSPAVTTADGSNPRIDTVEIRPLQTEYDSKVRQFKDPITGLVTTSSTETKYEYGYEVQILPGTPAGSPSAPASTAGWIKIAEVSVAALQTTITANDIKTYKDSDTWNTEANTTTWDDSILQLQIELETELDGLETELDGMKGVESVTVGENITAFDPIGLVDDEWLKCQIKLRGEVEVANPDHPTAKITDIGNGRVAILFAHGSTVYPWVGIYEYSDGVLSEEVAPEAADSQVISANFEIEGLSDDTFIISYGVGSNLWARIGHYTSAPGITWDTAATQIVTGETSYSIRRSGLTGDDFYLLYVNGITDVQMRLGYLNSTVIAWRTSASAMTTGRGSQVQGCWLHNDGTNDIFLNVWQDWTNDRRLEYRITTYTTGTLSLQTSEYLMYEFVDYNDPALPAPIYPFTKIKRLDSRHAAISFQPYVNNIYSNQFMIWEFPTDEITVSGVTGTLVENHIFNPPSKIVGSNGNWRFMPMAYFPDSKILMLMLLISGSRFFVYRWTGTSLETIGVFNEIVERSNPGVELGITEMRDTPGVVAGFFTVSGDTGYVQVYQVPLYDGVALTTVSDGDPVNIQRKGFVDGLSLIARKQYSMDYHTGTLTDDSMGDPVGKALSATRLLLD